MTTEAMPDWVLIEAAKRTNWYMPVDCIHERYSTLSDAFRALCDMILKHEQPPVDPDLLLAREAAAWVWDSQGFYGPSYASKIREGTKDHELAVEISLRAIKLVKEREA